MSASQLALDAPFSAEQQAWLAGFFAGIEAARGAAADAAPAATLTATILYGSQTGTSEVLAEDLVTAARAAGLGATLRALDDTDPAQLANESYVLVVTSTYGEGEMPDNAELFWEAFAADGAPRLEGVAFGVLALGDSGYDDFCQAGKLIDLRFEQLGATRLVPRTDCDVDEDDAAAAWIAGAVQALVARAPGAVATASADVAPRRERSPWNRRTPFGSRLVANRRVSGERSAKEIRHLELDLGDSGISYSAGDALAVVPRNDPALVELVRSGLGLAADTAIDGVPLVDLLHREWEISTPSRELVAAVAERDPRGELAERLAREDRAALDDWLWGKDTADLLAGTTGDWAAADLPTLFRPLQHRAYSISSSPMQSPDRIHLTVAAVRYGDARVHHGVCSTYLADRCAEDESVGIFLQPNAAFRLPADDDAPVIMVGPGTGVAPFRGFLHERAATGAVGRNWLFFGDQHRATDFIYEDEVRTFAERGVLDRLDLAFSRDQAEKVYVQSRMREQAADLYAWLEEGAFFYVCGDASRMARDVDAALLEVVARSRGRGEEDARAYVAELKRAKRYVRDVY